MSSFVYLVGTVLTSNYSKNHKEKFSESKIHPSLIPAFVVRHGAGTSKTGTNDDVDESTAGGIATTTDDRGGCVAGTGKEEGCIGGIGIGIVLHWIEKDDAAKTERRRE